MSALTIEQPIVADQKPSIELELDVPAFSGPLALLLELIERRKLPITEISIAQVADQYLERMRLLVGVDPEILADFLVVAARLLLLKSRELLPSAPVEETDEPDAASELQRRLLEYRIFREAAEQLRRLEEEGRRSYTPQPTAEAPPRPEPPLAPIQPEALRAAMIRMMKALQREPETLALSPHVSVMDRIEHLIDRLSSNGSAVFSELAGRTVHEVVATFLALLELLRRGVIAAEQDEAFADIRLSLVQIVDYAGVLSIAPIPDDPVAAGAGMFTGEPSATELLIKERRRDREHEDAR